MTRYNDTYTEEETTFILHLFTALVEEGVREMHVGPSSHEAFSSILLITRLRSEDKNGCSDIHFHSGHEMAENFLLFVSCALRLAEWHDDTMCFRMRREQAPQWWKQAEVSDEDRKLYRDIAQGFISEYPRLFTLEKAS